MVDFSITQLLNYPITKSYKDFSSNCSVSLLNCTGSGISEPSASNDISNSNSAEYFGGPPDYASGDSDAIVPARFGRAYAALAGAAGDPVEEMTLPGDHFALIAPGSAAWPALRTKILDLVK